MESSFRSKLQTLPSGYTYLQLPQTEGDAISFRIKEVNDKLSANTWKEKLSFCSKVTWRIQRTYPRSRVLNVYKVDLRCQHSSRHSFNGIRSTKMTNCPASLQIIVRRFNENNQKSSVMDAEWPAVITFRGQHNHSVNTAEVLKYRDLSQESKDKLRTLFQQGLHPASALQCLKTDLRLQHGDKYDEIASDRFYVPSLSVVHKLFKKELHGQFNEVSADNNLGNLSNMLENYCQSSSGKAELCQSSDGEHYFITICSPIMMRVHTMQQTKDLIMVDTLGGLHKPMHRLYLFMTPTAAGWLPVAAIVADSEKASVFREALVALKSILPEQSFNGKNMPKAFLTDSNVNEIEPIEQEFRNSHLIFNQFYFLRGVWSWLCDKAHRIPRTERQKLYFLVKDVLCAWDEESALEKHSLVLSSEVTARRPNFLQYYQMLWQNKDDWATYTRQSEIVQCKNPPNYIEAVFKIMNKCILEKALTFNLTQLITFILSHYEMELEKWLVDFCNERYPRSLLTLMLPKDPKNKWFSIKKSDTSGIFRVLDAPCKKNWMVDIDSCICSCIVGQMGKVCTHAATIVSHFEKDVCSEIKLVSKDVKQKIFYVATGSTAPDGWKESLNTSPDGETRSTVPDGWCESLGSIINAHLLQHESMNISDSDVSDAEPDISPVEVTVTETTSDTEDHVNAEQFAEFHALCARMQKGLEENPRLFKPALENMLKNEFKYSTEMGLATAMHNFGVCQDLEGCSGEQITRKRLKRKPVKKIK